MVGEVAERRMNNNIGQEEGNEIERLRTNSIKCF